MQTGIKHCRVTMLVSLVNYRFTHNNLLPPGRAKDVIDDFILATFLNLPTLAKLCSYNTDMHMMVYPHVHTWSSFSDQQQCN